jgi:phenylacetate-coenzyme A ligase PaaK-like adenylate-forming protein
MTDQWNHKIFTVDEPGFESLALEIFRYQVEENPVYRVFTQQLGIDPLEVTKINHIPFLPVSFFKTHQVATGNFQAVIEFESSGTTGTLNSRHFVRDINIYQESCRRSFESMYGPFSEWCILGLLPSYLERSHSSLVYMVDRFIHWSGHTNSGFFLHNHADLHEILEKLEAESKKTLLLGVTYALLDFAEKYQLRLSNTVIMETGGMKGRRHEMIREEVHEILKTRFGLDAIHSEYGMTELLSQAYSKGNGLFICPPWMKVRIRNEEDPLSVEDKGNGIVNVIDLANVYSCSFIATDDAGILHDDGSFSILGRVDGSDIRGCSLMTASW